jgi:uncharacterized protein YkwD
MSSGFLKKSKSFLFFFQGTGMGHWADLRFKTYHKHDIISVTTKGVFVYMKKILVSLAVLVTVFFTVSVFTACRSAPIPEAPPEEPPPKQCYVPYVPLPEAPPPKELPPFEPHAFERRVFELTNRERLMQRLPTLIWHEAAARVAREHSEDMHRNNFMRHTGSDGSDIRQRLERGCIKEMRIWSANIAGGYLTPETVVAAWMESPIYRQNILRREFTHMGVGFIERPADSNAHFATYWTQKFLALD